MYCLPTPLKNGRIRKDDPKEKAHILNRQFKSVFTEKRPIDQDRQPNNENPYPDIEDHDISTAGVHKLLENIKPNKAMGPYDRHLRVMKQLAPHVTPILQAIFTKSLKTSKVPDDWKRANVAPIYKKGKRYCAVNYRPVSLNCISSKLMEHSNQAHDHLPRRQQYPI